VTKPANEHERATRQFAELAFGGRYVFAPPKYRKGASTREPADLAWLCRDTVVLFYMADSTNGWEADREHNLKQAEGWLRMWRHPIAPRSLLGENPALVVPYDANKAIIILSVTDDERFPGLTMHPEWAANHQIDQCASISTTMMGLLARARASATDLAMLLKWWPSLQLSPGCTPAGALATLQVEGRNEAISLLGEQPPREHVAYFSRFIEGLQGVPLQGRDVASGPLDVFADFSFAEQMNLAFSLARGLEEINKGAGMASMYLDLLDCRTLLRVGANMQVICDAGVPSIATTDLCITIAGDLMVPMILVGRLRTPSLAWRVLRNMPAT
jgi:hypothetical protein